MRAITHGDKGAVTFRIRILLGIVIAGLVISGATAMPLETEVKILTRWIGGGSGLVYWLLRVRDGLVETNARYPFIAYGTDWLAFAHFVIAIAFIGPLRDPVKNIWVVEFGMIACALVVPLALVMGAVRGIPLGWRLIDCSFGLVGIIPLWLCRRWIKRLGELAKEPSLSELPKSVSAGRASVLASPDLPETGGGLGSRRRSPSPDR